VLPEIIREDRWKRVQASTDPHSPGQFRANRPLSNMPEFAKAFACAADSPMVRPASARASIW
jgi:putative endopeptidase